MGSFERGVIRQTNDLMRGNEEERAFAGEGMRELRAFYPEKFAALQEQNVDANLRAQENIAFDMDRFREEGDPWTQAGMEGAEYRTSVPYGFGGNSSIFGFGKKAAAGLERNGRVFMPGKYADDPFTVGHENRHAVISDGGTHGGEREELANRWVDLNLANRFGNAKEAAAALEYINRSKHYSTPMDAMPFQRKAGKKSAFANRKEVEPARLKGREKITADDMDQMGFKDIYEMFRRGDQFERINNADQVTRDLPDIGWLDEMKNWIRNR